MTTPGLFEANKPHDCEEHVAISIKGEMQKLWDRTVVHIRQAMEARRHPTGDYEPDFGERLRRLEGQLDDSEPRIRIERYDEGGGKHAWKDWILGLVALLIVAWLGKISLQMDKLTEVVVKQQEDEQRLDRIESRVFRGAP